MKEDKTIPRCRSVDHSLARPGRTPFRQRCVSRARILVTFLLFVPLSGCQRDYRFQSRAVYEAPQNKYRLEVEATGVVVAGDDLSRTHRGSVRLWATDKRQEDSPLRMRIRHNRDVVEYELPDGRTGTAVWNWKEAESSLAGLLAHAEFEIRAANEVAETVRVINGVMAGPKGTVMPGQTDVLNVIDVNF